MTVSEYFVKVSFDLSVYREGYESGSTDDVSLQVDDTELFAFGSTIPASTSFWSAGQRFTEITTYPFHAGRFYDWSNPTQPILIAHYYPIVDAEVEEIAFGDGTNIISKSGEDVTDEVNLVYGPTGFITYPDNGSRETIQYRFEFPDFIWVEVAGGDCENNSARLVELSENIEGYQSEYYNLRAEQRQLQSAIQVAEGKYTSSYEVAIAAHNLIALETFNTTLKLLHPALKGWAGLHAAAAVAAIDDHVIGENATDNKKEAQKAFLKTSSQLMKDWGEETFSKGAQAAGKSIGLISKAISVKDWHDKVGAQADNLEFAYSEMSFLKDSILSNRLKYATVSDDVEEVRESWMADYTEYQRLVSAQTDCQDAHPTTEEPEDADVVTEFSELPDGAKALEDLAEAAPDQIYENFFNLGADQNEISLDGANDIVKANGEDNRVELKGGDDLAAGGRGKDTVLGGAGDDWIHGGGAADRLLGNSGHDILAGGGGRDILRGGTGRDVIVGGKGDDKLFGGRGSDKLFGNIGDDTLNGGPGNDTLDGGFGDDCLVGGLGEDRFVFRDRGGSDTIKGFELYQDVIEISSKDTSYTDLAISGDGADTIIRFADVSIRLESVDPIGLTQDHFDFV